MLMRRWGLFTTALVSDSCTCVFKAKLRLKDACSNSTPQLLETTGEDDLRLKSRGFKMEDTKTKSPDGEGKSVKRFFARLSFKSEQKSYQIEPTKTFIVQSIGTAERKNPGEEGMDECLKSLYSKAIPKKDTLLKVKMAISPENVTMEGLGGRLIEEQDEVIVPISRISFVVADKKHQLFAFNDHVSNKPRKIITYAFICNDAESSATIAATLSTAFQEKLGRRSSRKARRTLSSENDQLP